MTAHQPFIKVCGTTSVKDALMAAEAGADYLGIIVDHPPSPRNVDTDTAAAIAAAVEIPVVAVTVNLSLPHLLLIQKRVQPAALQLHGDEPLNLIVDLRKAGNVVWATAAGDAVAARQRAQLLWDNGVEAVLVDSRSLRGSETVYGGTGEPADWELAAELVRAGKRLILAGGLSPRNVADAVRRVRPWMVDVISGVEAAKGQKDPDKLRSFISTLARDNS